MDNGLYLSPKFKEQPNKLHIPCIASACSFDGIESIDDLHHLQNNMTHLSLGDSRTCIILPNPTNTPLKKLWLNYLDKLEASGIFKAVDCNQRKFEEVLQDLRHLPPLEISPPHHAPAIGISLSMPHKLLPRTHEHKDYFIEQVIDNVCRDEHILPILIPPCADIIMKPEHMSVEDFYATDNRGMIITRKFITAAIAKNLSGFVGPGGADIDPLLYNQENTHSQDVNTLRDAFESQLFISIMESGLWYLGICRSHQLMNVLNGAKLSQDMVADGLTKRTRLGETTDFSMPYGHEDFRMMAYNPETEEAYDINAFQHQNIITSENFVHESKVPDIIKANLINSDNSSNYKPCQEAYDSLRQAALAHWQRLSERSHIVHEVRRFVDSCAFNIADHGQQRDKDIHTALSQIKAKINSCRLTPLSSMGEAWLNNLLSEEIGKRSSMGVHFWVNSFELSYETSAISHKKPGRNKLKNTMFVYERIEDEKWSKVVVAANSGYGETSQWHLEVPIKPDSR